MQPNQLDNQSAPTPTPTPTPAPSGAPNPDLVKALEESPATEPTAPNQPEPATNPKPKSSKLPWTCAILMTILALAGIGFGVYTFMDSNNKSDTISSLETKVKALNETIDNLQESPTETPAEPDDKQPTVTNTEDYIYIGEWGIKIKIPSNLDAVSYSYDPRVYSGGNWINYGELCIYGVKDLDEKELPSFWQNSGACVIAGPAKEGNEEMWPGFGNSDKASANIDDVYFWVILPQDISASTDNPDEKEWELSSEALVLETLKKSENYSKI